MRVLEAEILNVDYASAGAVASTRDKIAADLDATTAALTRAAAERELAAAMASEFINPSMGLLPAPAASDAANTIANDPMVKDRQDVIDALHKQVDEIREASAKFESYARGERPVPGARGAAAPLPASGGGASGGKGGGRDRKDEFEREVEKVTKRTAALQAETAVQAAINPLIEDYGFAVERAGVMQYLLTAAQEAGIAITPQLRAQMVGLAEAAGQATAASGRLAESQSEIVSRTQEMRDPSRDAAQGVGTGPPRPEKRRRGLRRGAGAHWRQALRHGLRLRFRERRSLRQRGGRRRLQGVPRRRDHSGHLA